MYETGGRIVAVQPLRQTVERMFACVTFGLTTPGVRTGSARIGVRPVGVTVREEHDCGRDERDGDEKVERRDAPRHPADARHHFRRPQDARAAVSKRGSRLAGHGRDRRPPAGPVLAGALCAARERRDAAGARGSRHRALWRRRCPRVAEPRRNRDDPVRVSRRSREAPLGARPRRRPLRVPAALRRRSLCSVARRSTSAGCGRCARPRSRRRFSAPSAAS